MAWHEMAVAVGKCFVSTGQIILSDIGDAALAKRQPLLWTHGKGVKTPRMAVGSFAEGKI